jgi:hypothetical protein
LRTSCRQPRAWAGAAPWSVDDGIHLADDAPSKPDRIVNEAAANAWTKVLWSGVAACPKR